MIFLITPSSKRQRLIFRSLYALCFCVFGMLALLIFMLGSPLHISNGELVWIVFGATLSGLAVLFATPAMLVNCYKEKCQNGGGAALFGSTVWVSFAIRSFLNHGMGDANSDAIIWALMRVAAGVSLFFSVQLLKDASKNLFPPKTRILGCSNAHASTVPSQSAPSDGNLIATESLSNVSVLTDVESNENEMAPQASLLEAENIDSHNLNGLRKEHRVEASSKASS